MMLLTFVFTVMWNVEVGIIVSMSVSLILIVKRSSKPHISILVRRYTFHSSFYTEQFLLRVGFQAPTPGILYRTLTNQMMK